jgi:hypothetical protein
LTPFCFGHFFGSEFSKVENDSVSFSTRIDQFCDLYYGDVFVKYKWSGGDIITLMGMDFTFDKTAMSYKLVESNVETSTVFDEVTMKVKVVERTVEKVYDSLTLICIGKSILRTLHSINEKGFVSDDSLNNFFINDVMHQMFSLKYRFSSLGCSELTYTMWYNLIFISYYYLVEKFLVGYKSGCVKDDFLLNLYDEGVEDVLSEMYELKSSFKSRLEQYLKMQVQVRGISIIENTYMGFDTEYVLKNQKRFLNELVSVQTAVQRRFILKMPLYKPYDISYVNPLSSVISDTFVNKVGSDNSYKYKFKNCGGDDLFNEMLVAKDLVNLNEVLLINNSLKSVVLLIRELLFKDLFDLHSKVLCGLKGFGFEFFEDVQRDQIVFCLPLTGLVSKFVTPSGDFSFLDLLDLSRSEDLCDVNGLESTQISTSFNSFRGGSFQTSASLDGISNFFLMFINFLSSFGLQSSKNFIKFYNDNKNKPRARTTLNFNFNNSSTSASSKISLTIVKNIFVLGHYNAADLSMLSDFHELKKQLSVVNKSFVSLGKPLRFKESFVYIRDTILLAPGGKNKLRDLSKLYSDVGVEKREISNKDLNNMKDFLKRDPEKFKDYALNDAIITLKHALAMEEFNMKLFQIGIPLTLSSIGRKYVLKE